MRAEATLHEYPQESSEHFPPFDQISKSFAYSNYAKWRNNSYAIYWQRTS